MSYSLRETLEGIPPLFGQERLAQPLSKIARQFLTELADAIDVDSPPEVVRRLAEGFAEYLDVAETRRRHRVVQAVIIQAGAGTPTPRVDAFANEWTSV